MEDTDEILCAADLFKYKPEDAVNFQEFFARYNDKFPMLAVVVDGLYGLTHFDTFENLQVIRIHGYTSQPRVVAIDDNEAKSLKYHYLTIPVNLPIKYHVVKSHTKLGKPQSMNEIIEENTLPVNVKIASSDYKSVRFGRSMVSCEHFGNLLIREKYIEHYFMVNHIDTRELVMNSIIHLGALSQDISATPVLGFKYDTEENYQKYLSKLDQQVAASGQDYDVTMGDPGIAKYNTEDIDIHTGKGGIPTYNAPRIDITTIMTDLDYEEPPPRPPRGHGKEQTRANESSEEECDMYEEIDDAPMVPPRQPVQKNTPSDSEGKIDKTPKSGKTSLFGKILGRQKTSKVQKEVANSTKSQANSSTPYYNTRIGRAVVTPLQLEMQAAKVMSPAGLDDDDGDYEEPFEEMSSAKPSGKPTDAQVERSKGGDKNHAREVHNTKCSRVGESTTGVVTGDEDDYIMIPVGNNPPLRVKCNRKSESIDSGLVKLPPTEHQISEGDLKPKPKNPEAGTKSIKTFTINEICETLRSLKLEKYIGKFREEQISGEILEMLSDQDLQNELGMKRLEAVRLCAFVKSGHIPM